MEVTVGVLIGLAKVPLLKKINKVHILLIVLLTKRIAILDRYMEMSSQVSLILLLISIVILH